MVILTLRRYFQGKKIGKVMFFHLLPNIVKPTCIFHVADQEALLLRIKQSGLFCT